MEPIELKYIGYYTGKIKEAAGDLNRLGPDERRHLRLLMQKNELENSLSHIQEKLGQLPLPNFGAPGEHPLTDAEVREQAGAPPANQPTLDEALKTNGKPAEEATSESAGTIPPQPPGSDQSHDSDKGWDGVICSQDCNFGHEPNIDHAPPPPEKKSRKKQPLKDEVKIVAFADHTFLLSLIDEGMIWEHRDPHTTIKVIATRGNNNDWAAYCQTPESGDDNTAIKELGNKIPAYAGKEMFPKWEMLTYKE